MKTLQRLMLSIFAAFSLLVAVPAVPTHAIDLLGPACQSGGENSAACTDKDGKENPLTGEDGVIMRIVNIVATVAGAAAVIIIVLAGLRFVTSGGSSDDVAGARRTIIYAAIGLVILVLARTLVAFVLGKL